MIKEIQSKAMRFKPCMAAGRIEMSTVPKAIVGFYRLDSNTAFERHRSQTDPSQLIGRL